MKPRKEIFDEILPSLPLNFFENRLDSRLHTVPMHWHDRLEIIRVVDGEGVLSLDLQEYPLQAGDIVTIMPGALHAIRGGSTILHSRTVTFSTRILEDWTPVHFIPLIHTDMPGSAAFLHTMDALFQLRLQPDNGCESILRHYLAALCGLYAHYGYQREGLPPVSAGSQSLKRVLQYMEHHCGEELTVEHLAQVGGYSKYHFSRFFSASMGCSCIKYLQGLRVEKARHLLLHTSLSVAEISHLTGFGEVSYFICVFRRTTGLTPLQFRRVGEGKGSFHRLADGVGTVLREGADLLHSI